jgi:hypothetical protein
MRMYYSPFSQPSGTARANVKTLGEKWPVLRPNTAKSALLYSIFFSRVATTYMTLQ